MAASDVPRGLDQLLCFALYRASRAMTRAYGPLLEPLGITYPQYLVLLALWEEDGATMKRLGERLGLDSGTLTPLAKRLAEQALVVRRRSQDDERVVHLDLTKKGRALQHKARGVPEALACRVIDLGDQVAFAKLVKLKEELDALVCKLEAAG